MVVKGGAWWCCCCADAAKQLMSAAAAAAYANKQIYDKLLVLFGALHNKLLGLKMATLGHYLFVAAFDAAIAAMNAAIVYAHLAVLFGLANPAGKDKAGGKGSKATVAKEKAN